MAGDPGRVPVIEGTRQRLRPWPGLGGELLRLLGVLRPGAGREEGRTAAARLGPSGCPGEDPGGVAAASGALDPARLQSWAASIPGTGCGRSPGRSDAGSCAPGALDTVRASWEDPARAAVPV